MSKIPGTGAANPIKYNLTGFGAPSGAAAMKSDAEFGIFRTNDETMAMARNADKAKPEDLFAMHSRERDNRASNETRWLMRTLSNIIGDNAKKRNEEKLKESMSYLG